MRYSTFLGGTGGTLGSAIAIDGEGDAYVTGLTFSEDFPTVKALQPKFGGGGGERAVSDAFASELSPDGSHLIYSTYLGGEASDEGNGISVDEAGDAFVAGTTASSNFPTDGGATFTTAPEAFVTEINAGGARGYSRLLGGLSQGHAIAVNGAGDAYAAGTTGTELNSSGEQQSAFVTKLSTSGEVSFSTPLGGGAEAKESASGIAIDAAGDANVAGIAEWLRPTTPAGFAGGVSDAFNAKVNPGGGVGFATTSAAQPTIRATRSPSTVRGRSM